jgi:tetraacyldisaccharide 4'-kinase
MGRLVERLWYRTDESLVTRVLCLPLWLVSLVWGALARRRVEKARLPGRARRVEAKVISVGNITAGGAGKTPVVIHLARWLVAKGEKPFVLSRGWGREHPSRELLVSDGSQIRATVREAGDEPLLIARSCPGASVIVGRDRAEAAQTAVAESGARTILLDDGMQHVGLARDLEIVVLDAANPFGNGAVLPRGPLREPKEGLSRAGLFWFAKVEQANDEAVAALEAEVRRYSPAPIVKAAYRVADVLDDAWHGLGPRALAGKRVLMMAGIARPGSFRRTLESLGATIVEERIFGDHHWYRPMDVEGVKLRAGRLGVDAIALTEKDAVRLPDSAAKGPFAIVRIEVEIRAGEEALAKLL